MSAVSGGTGAMTLASAWGRITRRYRLGWDALLVVAVGVAVSVLGAYFVHAAEARRIDALFQQDATAFASALEREIQMRLRDSEVLGTLAENVPFRTAEDFRHATTPFLDRVGALAWVEPVLRMERGAFETELAAGGADLPVISRVGDTGRLVSADASALYFPVRFLVSDLEARLPVGLDMTSEPRRAAALRRAVESRRIAVSEPVLAVLDGAATAPGLLLFQPVFGGINATRDSGFRLTGVLVSLITFEALLGRVEAAADAGQRLLELGLALGHEHTGGVGPIIGGAVGDVGPGERLLSRPIWIADAAYTLKVHATPAYLAAFSRAYWLLWLLGGFAITLLGWRHVTALRMQRERAMQLVDARTAELRDREERLAFALDNARDGVWDWRADTGKVFYSARWKSMLGYDESDIGDTYEEWEDRVHPDDLPRAREDLRRHFSGETPVYVNEHRMRCRDGSYKWILDRGKVVDWIAPGQARRIIGTHSDISERKRLDLEIREARAYLASVLDAATQVAIIASDAEGRVTLFNRGAEAMLGYRAADIIGHAHLDRFHLAEELRARRTEARQRPVEVILEQARSARQGSREWTYRRRDGRLISVDLIITPIRDGDHEPGRGVLCVAIDVTESRTMERALRERDERFARLTAAVPGAIYQYELGPDGTSRFPYASRGMESVFEVTADALRDDASRVFERIHRDDVLRVTESIMRSAETLREWREEYRVELPEKGLRWLRGEAMPERLPDGGTLWHGYITDVTREKAVEAELRRLSYRDQLTGLYNRRHLQQRLRDELARYQRYGETFTVVMFDLDHFKVINDRHGHGRGDAVLMRVAELLRRRLRQTDVPARWGGEEFLVLCPNAVAAEITDMVDLLRRSVEASATGLGLTSLSASFAVASVRPGDSDESLLRRVDGLLYEAKHAGRNQVRIDPG